jgi:glycosyltransferase involved in cell wall biosynthesis
MKILIHSNAPWCPTGYGTQCQQLVPRLASLGHEVAVSAFFGLQGGPTTWQGHMIYPAGQHPYGGDVAGMHARHFGADWIITLMDQWALPHNTLAGLNVACWMPVDCEPLGVFDFEQLRLKQQHARNLVPVALTQFGKEQLDEAGFRARYVPHGIDTEVFRPPNDKKALRKAMGVDDRFVIFTDAANLDKGGRKGWAETFAAFARFGARHEDALLVVHGLQQTGGGLDLVNMAARMGLVGNLKWSDQYLHTAGLIRPEVLRGSYGMADLYTGCSLAEGFGLCPVQSMACEVPVVVTDGTCQPEVCGPGAYLVKGEKTWAEGHKAWWRRPLIGEIVKAYEKAYLKGGPYTAKAKKGRDHVLATYDADVVFSQHWKPLLDELEGMLS